MCVWFHCVNIVRCTFEWKNGGGGWQWRWRWWRYDTYGQPTISTLPCAPTTALTSHLHRSLQPKYFRWQLTVRSQSERLRTCQHDITPLGLTAISTLLLLQNQNCFRSLFFVSYFPVHRWCHPLRRLCFNYFMILIQPFNVCPFSLQCWMSSQFHLTLPSAQLTESNYYQWGCVLLQSGNVLKGGANTFQTWSKLLVQDRALSHMIRRHWWRHIVARQSFRRSDQLKKKKKGANIKGTQLICKIE